MQYQGCGQIIKCTVANENWPYAFKVVIGLIDQKDKRQIFGEIFYWLFLLYNLWLTLTVKILLVVPEVGIFFIKPLAAISCIWSTYNRAQTWEYTGRGLSMCVGESTTPIFNELYQE